MSTLSTETLLGCGIGMVADLAQKESTEHIYIYNIYYKPRGRPDVVYTCAGRASSPETPAPPAS